MAKRKSTRGAGRPRKPNAYGNTVNVSLNNDQLAWLNNCIKELEKTIEGRYEISQSAFLRSKLIQAGMPE